MSQVKRIDLSRIEIRGQTPQDYAQKEVVKEFMSKVIYPRYRLMLNYATGVGKAKAAIDVIKAFWEAGSKAPFFIGCFTEKARDSVWQHQLRLWGDNHAALQSYQIECYASMPNIKGCHFGVVVLDEGHHLTPLSYSFFEQNTFEGVLILTATEPRDNEKKILMRNLTGGRKMIITADDAIGAGILNDFEVYVVHLTMDDTRQTKLFKNSNTLYTELTGYHKQCSLLQQAKHSGDSMRIKFAALNRQRFVGSMHSKTLATAYIQQRFRDKGDRFITFANSIDQANLLSKYVFHSKTTDDHYYSFLRGDIDELISVKQIREAENFANLGRAVVTQVDSNPGNMLQMIGRLMRLPVGEVSRLYVLCMDDTEDVTWVTKALSKTSSARIFTHKMSPDIYKDIKL